MKVKNFGIILTPYNLATLFSFDPYNITKMMANGGEGKLRYVSLMDEGGGARVTNQGLEKSQPAQK